MMRKTRYGIGVPALLEALARGIETHAAGGISARADLVSRHRTEQCGTRALPSTLLCRSLDPSIPIQPHPTPLTCICRLSDPFKSGQLQLTPIDPHHAHCKGIRIDRSDIAGYYHFVSQTERKGLGRENQPRKEDARKMRETQYARSVCGRGPTVERAQ